MKFENVTIEVRNAAEFGVWFAKGDVIANDQTYKTVLDAILDGAKEITIYL